MNLIDQARKDILRITTDKNSGFAKDIIFIDPEGNEFTVACIYSEHFSSMDLQGNTVNSRVAHLCVSEKALTDLRYETRDGKGNASMANLKQNKKHKVIAEGKTYSIRECYPSTTTGLFVLMLQDHV